MSTFAIITDSTCDLEQSMLERYDIDYAPMNYTIGPDEYPAMLDWSSHSAHDFYEFMRCGTIIKTTQVPAAAFEKKFKNAIDAGKDVLYISCSSALSGSVNIARMVAKDLEAANPERKIRIVDSLISSLGQGYMCMKASDMRSEGKSLDEVADYLEANKLHVLQYATVGSLEYLKRAGRVTASSAFFGNFLGIKPILISDKLGQNYAVKKAKGAGKARQEIANMIAEDVIDPESQTLYISHADDLKEAEAWRDLIMEQIPFKDCYINYIAPIVGASVGPGTVSAYILGKEMTIEGGE